MAAYAGTASLRHLRLVRQRAAGFIVSELTLHEYARLVHAIIRQAQKVHGSTQTGRYWFYSYLDQR